MLAPQDQLPSPFVSLLKERLFIPSAQSSPQSQCVMAQPSDSPSTDTFADRLQLGAWGLWRAILGGRTGHHSLLSRPGSSTSTRLFVYRFLANEPCSSAKKFIQTDSKDESCRKTGREQGDVFELGAFSPAKWRGECCCSERTIKNTKYRLSGASDVVLLYETWFLIFK